MATGRVKIWNRTKGGDIYAEMLTIDAIRDAGGQVKQYVGLFTDITEVKEHEQQLELAAHYDALTGLPNRALLADRLRQAMAQARRRNQLLGVACFDLDGFKAINDGYGHSSGDALLTALAFRMNRALREGDTLARLGGDEFAAVILDLPDRDACLPTLTQHARSRRRGSADWRRAAARDGQRGRDLLSAGGGSGRGHAVAPGRTRRSTRPSWRERTATASSIPATI